MNKSTALLNELIEIARDGQRFYLEAAQHVRSADLQATFRDMARVREELIADLGMHVFSRGESPSGDQTVVGTARRAYASILARIKQDKEAVYISELEEAEDRLLEHYRKAMVGTLPPDVRAILERHLLTVQAAHEAMSTMKEQVTS